MVLGRDRQQAYECYVVNAGQVKVTDEKLQDKEALRRVNIMGGLRYHDRSRVGFFIDRSNADSFFEQLVKLGSATEVMMIAKVETVLVVE